MDRKKKIMKKSSNKILFSITVLSILLFLGISKTIKGSFFQLDNIINSYMVSIHNQSLIQLSRVIGFIFGPTGMVIISILVTILLWIKISKKEAIFFSIVMLIMTATFVIIKNIIKRARPINRLVNETSLSFPSGHSVAVFVFFGLMILLITKRIKYKKLELIIVSSLMILLIGFTRIYLNVHWFSDIISGFLLGLFILTLSILIFKKIITSSS